MASLRSLFITTSLMAQAWPSTLTVEWASIRLDWPGMVAGEINQSTSAASAGLEARTVRPSLL